MRSFFLGMICSLLTGCLYYGDIHGKSHPLPLVTLDTPRSYPKHADKAPCNKPGWWQRFKDPDLNQLIDIAVACSPTMHTAEARVRRAQNLAAGADAAQWPTIDFSGYVQRQRFSQFGLVPPPFNGKIFNIGELGLNFNYEFDFWGKHSEFLKARIGEILAANADRAEARLIISSTVANTYFQLLSTIQQSKLARARVSLDTQLLEIANTRLSHGIATDIPVKSIEADLQAAKQILDQQKLNEALARHQLAVLLGNNPLNTEILTRAFTYHHYAVSLPASLPANLLCNRPDVRAAKWRAQAAAHEINVAKARFFPDINLNILFSYQTAFFGKLFEPGSQNNAITGAVDLPLFDAGARRANLGVRYAEYDIAVNEYNQTILNALQDVADQLSIAKSIQAQLQAQRKSLHAIQHNYDLYLARYHHGITDYVDVLSIKSALLKQQADQVSLQTHDLQTTVAIIKALGGHYG